MLLTAVCIILYLLKALRFCLADIITQIWTGSTMRICENKFE